MTVNIVNGDSTKALLLAANFDEKLVVWREMLCEGPCIPAIGSKEFWDTRANFIGEYIDPGERLRYFPEVVEEIQQVDQALPNIKEVVLWFEQDLFCQINLLGCLTYLDELNPELDIQLVLPEILENGDYKAIGYHNPKDALNLLKNKRSVTREEIMVAKVMWNLWCSQNYEKMLSLLEEKTDFFPFLKIGIRLQIDLRVPQVNGLTRLQEYILALKQNPKMDKQSIIKACLTNKAFTWLGLGDLQYEKIYEGLAN